MDHQTALWLTAKHIAAVAVASIELDHEDYPEFDECDLERIGELLRVLSKDIKPFDGDAELAALVLVVSAANREDEQYAL